MSTEQRVTKQYILDHIDEDEVDLSLCSLTSVPVKELVSHFITIIIYISYGGPARLNSIIIKSVA